MTALSGYRGDPDRTGARSCPAVLKWSSPSLQSLQDRHELFEVYSRLDILIYNLTQYSREKDRQLHHQMVSIGIGWIRRISWKKDRIWCVCSRSRGWGFKSCSSSYQGWPWESYGTPLSLHLFICKIRTLIIMTQAKPKLLFYFSEKHK